MPDPDNHTIKSFESGKDLNRWLNENYNTENELWVRIFKKNTGIPSVTWKEVVIEALCWGWIDGIKKSYDEQSYLQRITPRRSRSTWSKINTEHAEKLIQEGRMEAPGLVQVQEAKKDGRWDKAYSTSEMEVPLDFIAALDSRPKAKRFYETLTKSNRFVIAYGLGSAKKTETRSRRFNKYLKLLEQEKKPH